MYPRDVQASQGEKGEGWCACVMYTTRHSGIPGKAEQCSISLTPGIPPKDGTAGHSKQVTLHREKKPHEPEVAVSCVPGLRTLQCDSCLQFTSAGSCYCLPKSC